MTPLERALKSRDMTINELANRTNVPLKNARKWLTGSLPRRTVAARVARELDTTVDDLWPGRQSSTRLQSVLGRRGLTARKAAALAGVHENSFYSWTSGNAGPTVAAAC